MPMIPLTGQNTVPDGDAALLSAFSEQAYATLAQKFPMLMDKVATFKVLESDLASNKALGVFIAIINGNAIYIPVIMGENSLKPMVLFYFRKKDQFLPLSAEWLRRVTSETPASMGQPAQVPGTAEADFNLRNIVRAPGLLGRFSYASAIDVLEKAPNGVKLAFERLLKSNDALLEKAYNTYGPSELARALRLVKQAAKTDNGVYVHVDFATPGFVEAFGNNKVAAYNDITSDGFAVKDLRTGKRDRLIKLATEKYTEIKDPGFYEVVTNSGTRKVVYAIPNMASTQEEVPALRRYKAPGTGSGYPKQNGPMLFLDSSGSYVGTYKSVLGKPITEGAEEPFVAKMRSGSTPNVGSFGVFAYRKDNNSVVFTAPIHISKIVDSDGATTYVGSSDSYGGDVTFTRDSKVPVVTFKDNKSTGTVQMPPKAIFIALGSRDYSTELVGDPARFMDVFDRKVVRPVKVANTGGAYSINNRESTSLKVAVETLMMEYNLGTDDVKYIKNAADVRPFTGLVAKRNKKASIFDGIPEGQPVEVDPTQYMPTEEELAMAQMAPEEVDPGMPQEAMPQDDGQDVGMPQEAMPQDDGLGEVSTVEDGQEDPSMMEEAPMDPGMDPSMGMMQQAPQAPVSYQDDITLMPGMEGLVSNMAMNDPGILDAAVVTSLAKVPVMRDLVMSYVPNLRQTLDNLGRLILAVWINEGKVRDSAGSLTYTSIEDNLMNAFNTLGTALLRLYDSESQLGM